MLSIPSFHASSPPQQSVSIDGAYLLSAEYRKLKALNEHGLATKVHKYHAQYHGEHMLEWFIMDVVEGRSLSDVLCDDYPEGMPEEMAVAGAVQVLTHLNRLLEAGYAHCDIKASNIIVTPQVGTLSFVLTLGHCCCTAHCNYTFIHEQPT